MSNAWQRLKAWGEKNAPIMLEDLNPGASEAEIFALENTLQSQIPEAFKASLRIHNGECDGWPSKVFADYGAYLGTSRILEQWTQRKTVAETLMDDPASPEQIERQIATGIIFVEGPVQPVLYLKEWIPVMECNGDVFWAIDLNPAAGGTIGQMIEVDWEGCSWKVIASSFSHFFEQYLAKLESGAYKIVDGLPTMEQRG